MSQCIGKIRHASEEDAKAHLERLSHPSKLNTYECDLCKGWHVGHKVSSRKGQQRKVANGQWFWNN